MKKFSVFAVFTALISGACFGATYSDSNFRSEVSEGLDLIGARKTAKKIEEVAPGELGREVYIVSNAVSNDNIRLYIPTSMYVRMGGGLNLGGATNGAYFNGKEYESSGGYTTQIGLGWNLSSFVRAEIDLQNTVLKFPDLDDQQATQQSIGGMLYFDLARRYVQTGDVTRRRTFVPFIGVGAGVGVYEFEGTGGANGVSILAPRAVAGLNIMLTDLMGIDVAYQYQMNIGNGFGWNVRDGGTDSISNVIATIRMNF